MPAHDVIPPEHMGFLSVRQDPAFVKQVAAFTNALRSGEFSFLSEKGDLAISNAMTIIRRWGAQRESWKTC